MSRFPTCSPVTRRVVAERARLVATLTAETAQFRTILHELRELRQHLPFLRFRRIAPIAGSSDEDYAKRNDAVRVTVGVLSKLSAGILPVGDAFHVWVGRGTDGMCDACDQPIPAQQVEYEVDCDDLGPYRFHRQCFAVWDRERRWYQTHKAQRPALS
jgi:hypothetical protein